MTAEELSDFEIMSGFTVIKQCLKRRFGLQNFNISFDK